MSRNVKSSLELTPNAAYELIHEEYLDDIKSAGMVFRHKKSGARVCILSNNDENKMFCAAFRTPPENSTGVPHIIEHSVLNGSRNFPSRDPFMQLAKSSLNTFLNAMTYPDKTMYPVASCNDKDFRNLMHVYMDAVFYPNIYNFRQIFMQEGWHYEMENADDELKINGVVYSEMKGAMSSPDRAVYSVLEENLYPDTTYGVNSGGDPDVIPELSYEDFINFHRRFYHPSNSYIFVYGDFDVEERLAFMDENYLSAFDVIEPNSEIKPQSHFGEGTPKRITKPYSVGSTDETDGKSFLGFATVVGSNLDVLDARAWAVLENVLINSDGAPLKQALIDASIGEDVYGGFGNHMLEDNFSVVVKNAKSEDIDKFYEIITDVLKKQVEDGIDEKSLLAVINRAEFAFREADYGGFPRGLDYASNMLQSWLYDDNAPFDYMHVLADFAELKKRIGTGYYEGLIKKYILESDHSILVDLVPERGLVEKKNEELKARLAEYKASLSADEIAHIVEETKLLREYQSREATEEEQNCIPSLERSDIPRETVPFYNEEREIGGCRAVYHDVETNGITYAECLFKIDRIPQKYIPYVGLLGYVLGRVDTASHSYKDLDTEIKLNTGSLNFRGGIVRSYRETGEFYPTFSVSTKVLAENVPFAFECALEVIRESRFDDAKRIRALLAELKSDNQRMIIGRGHSVAVNRVSSYFSKSDAYLEKLSGLDFYMFICDLLDNFDERAGEIAENLRLCANYVFNEKNMTLSLAADEAGYTAVEAAVAEFAIGLASVEHASLGEADEIVPEVKNEGIMIPSPVNYVAMGGNLSGHGVKYTGAMQVVRNAVNVDYLYQQIRVKGGAYGCGCGFSGETMKGFFWSFRDPNLTNTLEVYKGTGEFTRTVKFDEKELTKYIIGTFSDYERPISPAGKASRSFSAYLAGKTYEDVVRERGEMLDITEEEFRAVAPAFDAVVSENCFCVVGNEKAILDNCDMFGTTIAIK